jgi:hypothetical protein
MWSWGAQHGGDGYPGLFNNLNIGLRISLFLALNLESEKYESRTKKHNINHSMSIEKGQYSHGNIGGQIQLRRAKTREQWHS